MSLVADRLFGWTPVKAAWRGAEMVVDWCNLGDGRMTDPFFHETATAAMRKPFNLVFQQHTPIAAASELPPGLAPSGFLFHMSRCGSTLVSQALAAFESNIVVSEAAPLSAVLAAARSGRASRDEARAWLAGLVNAYGQRRFSYETLLFVTFAAADVLDIALVREAFPDVPWVFLTRDPAEIIASHARSGGLGLAQAELAPARMGLAAPDAGSMEPPAYEAHVLAALGRAALDAHDAGNGLILDHRDLPEALWTTLPAHFRFGLSPAAAELMWRVGQHHAETPGAPVAAERDPDRDGAAPFRAIAEPITAEVMAALAARRPRT